LKFNNDEIIKNIKALVLDVDGTLTDGTIYIGSQGETMKAFNAADGLGIALWKMAGYKVFIITGRNSLIVGKRASELDVDEVMQGIDDKINALKIIAERNSLDLSEICYIGDDLNDISAMKECGFSMAVAQASEFVKENSNIVLSNNGGYGAVREGIEIILKEQNKLEKIIKKYIGVNID
jgi:3-deoxy-D-manno-octulosonate 8-phosphate phosphatase (KDO 8-P phosphatase)